MNLLSFETTAIVTALNQIATNATTVVNDVAPVGISIFGVFMVWKLGIKMFKTLAGK